MFPKTRRSSRCRLVLFTARMMLAVWVFSLFFGLNELLAGSGKPATKLVNVADTRSLEPGLTKWIADLYNSDLWLFSLFTIVVMALMGLILGTLFDRAMILFGIHLGKIEHHE